MPFHSTSEYLLAETIDCLAEIVLGFLHRGTHGVCHLLAGFDLVGPELPVQLGLVGQIMVV